MGDRKGIYRVVVRKLESERPLGRPRNRWEDNIKTDPQEEECDVWTGSVSGNSQRLFSQAIENLSTLSKYSLFSSVQDSSK